MWVNTVHLITVSRWYQTDSKHQFIFVCMCVFQHCVLKGELCGVQMHYDVNAQLPTMRHVQWISNIFHTQQTKQTLIKWKSWINCYSLSHYGIIHSCDHHLLFRGILTGKREESIPEKKGKKVRLESVSCHVPL